MATKTSLTIDQLKRAVALHEQIEKLQAELAVLLGEKPAGKRGRKPGRKAKAAAAEGVEGEVAAPGKKARKKRAKRVISEEARERIAAAQRKRWAKAKKDA